MMAEKSKLSALLTGVMSAVQKAATTAGQQNLHILKHYFKEDTETGQLVPLYTRIEVSPGKVMDIPLICLMEPAGYKLDELEMDLSLRLQLAEVKKAVEEVAKGNTLKKGSYNVELCPKDNGREKRASDVVDVKVKFKASEPAEGLSRIIEDLNNTISPMPAGSAPKRSTLTVHVNKSDSDIFDTAPTPPDGTPIVLDDGEELEPQDHRPDTENQTGIEEAGDGDRDS